MRVLATGARVLGNTGDDWLTAGLRVVADGHMSLTTDLRGGAGDDHLRATLVLEDADIDFDNLVSAHLSGGAGDDLLRLRLGASDASLRGVVDGGAGDDRITVTDEPVSGGFGPLGEDLAVRGGAGDDVIRLDLYLSSLSSELAAAIGGGRGEDRIFAHLRASGDDGGEAAGRIGGGGGDDHIRLIVEGVETGVGGDEHAMARGGAGDDRIAIVARGFNAFETAQTRGTGDGGDDVVTALCALTGDYGEASNRLDGGRGDDRLTARLDLGSAFGSSGLNLLRGGAGDDRLLAIVKLEEGHDTAAHSELSGGAGDDWLTVRGGDGNILDGGGGDDALRGGARADRLIGGRGADDLLGGGGDDAFVFRPGDGPCRDRVADFAHGHDVIDFSGFDADATREGDQAFAFGGGHGAGHVWLSAGAGGASLIHAAAGTETLVVAVLDGQAGGGWSAEDFIL
ncbi:calcium-binding protein [Amaricoccus solimangrovi]|uniref:Peptidase M10 serralysin C-terminal domain-containing protein n=1 Tax=Amaricoccus solimangrovi TaxID=2589815 RepID=A0A501WWE1_9RHOB|nr:hypothetical protein [Amaricoccus solimangrovi]TPE53778.1 hypothetical protein FJM51_01655 [Amaricoccus solimangrovi]